MGFFSRGKQAFSKLFSGGTNRPFRGTTFYVPEKESLAQKECCKEDECPTFCKSVIGLQEVDCPLVVEDPVYQLGLNCYRRMRITFGDDYSSPISFEDDQPRFQLGGRVFNASTGLQISTAGLVNAVIAIPIHDNCIYPISLESSFTTIIPLADILDFSLSNGKYLIIYDIQGYYPSTIIAEINGSNVFQDIYLTPLPPGISTLMVLLQQVSLGVDSSGVPNGTVMVSMITKPWTIRVRNNTTGIITSYTVTPDQYGILIIPGVVGHEYEFIEDQFSCYRTIPFDTSTKTIVADQGKTISGIVLPPDFNEIPEECNYPVFCGRGITHADSADGDLTGFEGGFSCVKPFNRFTFSFGYTSFVAGNYTIEAYFESSPGVEVLIGSITIFLSGNGSSGIQTIDFSTAIANQINASTSPGGSQVYVILKVNTSGIQATMPTVVNKFTPC